MQLFDLHTPKKVAKIGPCKPPRQLFDLHTPKKVAKFGPCKSHNAKIFSLGNFSPLFGPRQLFAPFRPHVVEKLKQSTTPPRQNEIYNAERENERRHTVTKVKYYFCTSTQCVVPKHGFYSFGVGHLILYWKTSYNGGLRAPMYKARRSVRVFP